jgi:hypothetical protein
LRVRLGAVALGVVLVAGSVVWIGWSVRTSGSHSGFGAVMVGNPTGSFDLTRHLQGYRALEPRITVRALRPGFERELRKEMDLLEHVIDGFARSHSMYDGVRLWEYIHRTGWWAPTRESAEHSLLLSERQWSGGYLIRVPFEEYAQAFRAQLADAPRQPAPGSILDELLRANGQTTRTRVLWSGYLINAATIAGLGLIGWGAWGVPGGIRARRVRAGKCAKCTYDLRGLGEARCPECGTPLPVACGDHPPPCGEREAEPDSGREPAG